MENCGIGPLITFRNGGASPPDTERVEAYSSDTEGDAFSSEPLVIQPSPEDSSFIVTQTNPESTSQNSGSVTDQTVEQRYSARIFNPPDRFMRFFSQGTL